MIKIIVVENLKLAVMLYQISSELIIKFNEIVYFIDDNVKDIEAAKIAGCTIILVKKEIIDLTKVKQYFF